MSRLAARFLVLAGALAVALVAAEQLLRLFDYRYRPLTVAVRDQSDARFFHLFTDSHFVYDPELIWRPKSGYGVFNTEGYRGPELDGQGGEALRIVAIGDSNTLGWAGEEGANWPGALGRRLRAAGVDAVVVNAGVWGYSSYQGVRRLAEVLAHEPDVVLVSFGANDAHRVNRADREFSAQSPAWRRFRIWLADFRVAQLTTATWRGLAARRRAELVPRVDLEEYRDNLRQMTRAAAARGARLILLTRPFQGPVHDAGWWKNFAYDYNVATVEVATDEGLPVVDLYTWFKGRDELFADESHFTSEGHERAAAIVEAELLPLIASVEAR